MTLLRRVAVVVFVAAFAVVPVDEQERWPLTSWKLFSQPRHATQPTWRASYVDDAGREHDVAFDDLGRPFSGALHVLQRWPALAPARRGAIAAAWQEAIERQGGDVSAIRVYRVVVDVATGEVVERARVDEVATR